MSADVSLDFGIDPVADRLLVKDSAPDFLAVHAFFDVEEPMVGWQVTGIDFFPGFADDHELLVLPETLVSRSVYPRLAHGAAFYHIRPEDEPDISVKRNLLQYISCRGVLGGL